MPLIGNPYVIGDTTSNFKILDDLSSYTLTFNPTSEMNLGVDTISVNDHRFITGQRVVYNNGGGSNIGGLTSGNAYYIINSGLDTIKLASSYSDALLGNSIDLATVGSGFNHTITLGFDGVNTRFRATFNGGQKAAINAATQLIISINGVLQRPHLSSTPSDGYGIEHPSIIVFSTPPVGSDVFWGNIIANSFPTYDITDHRIDNFTGNNTLTDFTLSKIVPNSQSILVTLDGAVQSPTDVTATRDYSVVDSVLSFTTPPGNNVKIQVRHLGFVGAVSSNVTGFYGRTGNVGLTTSDNIEVLTAKIGAGTTFTEDLVVEGDGRITGILTIGTGTITLDGDTNTVNVGTALTLSHTNGVIVGESNLHTTGLEVKNINATGIATLSTLDVTENISVVGVTTFSSDVAINAGLDVTGHTELDNVNISGVSTLTGTLNAVDAIFSGNVTIGGTLSYEDVTNIDSVGIITARSDVRIDGNLSSVGITTLASAGGITTTGGDLYVGNNASVGIITARSDVRIDGNLSSVGITTLASAGGITTTGGDLYVGNNASVTGTVTASDYIKADGSPINGSIGIQSAGTVIGTGFTTLNFIGAGNTFAINGTTVDISITGGSGSGGGGGGGGLGTAIAYDDGEVSPFSYIDSVRRVSSNLNMTNVNAGASDSYIVSVSPNIIIEAGVGVTVGAGKTMIIDVLKIGGL